MSTRAVAALFMALFAGVYSLRAETETGWLPHKEQVALAEARLTLPSGADRMESYDRYYSGTWIGGRRMIEGYFVSRYDGRKRKRGRIHIVVKLEPWIADGGCSVITVYFDIATQRQAAAFCNGLA